MRILLFGRDGQLGWELQRSLAVLGEVVAVGSKGDDPATHADFRDPGAVAAMVRRLEPGLVVNAAAYTAVDRAETEPETAFLVNAAAVGAIAEAAAASKAWLVHYSTDYVFDGSGDAPWTETDRPAPLNVYGRSKWEGEEFVRRSGAAHLIFRTCWVYAARGQNFARTMLRLARERDALSVVDDQVGAPTGADLLADVTAHALRLALQRPDVAGTYHAVAGGCTSWHGYARRVIEAARARGEPIRVAPDAIRPVPSAAYPQAARRPLNSRMATARLREVFGLSLPDWTLGVDRMLAEILPASRSPESPHA